MVLLVCDLFRLLDRKGRDRVERRDRLFRDDRYVFSPTIFIPLSCPRRNFGTSGLFLHFLTDLVTQIDRTGTRI